MISVLLSVYAKEKPSFLDQALSSIYYDQTLKPSEIVLVLDGVLPIELSQTIATWKKILDDKLVVVALKENVGLGAALNEGLKYCKYEIIARMDTDDIAVSTRFEKQLEVFKNNKDLDVLGTYAYLFSTSLTEESLRKVPVDHDAVISNLWACPFVHPTVVFKKTAILNIGGYNPKLKRRQDYDLWFRCAKAGLQFANIPEPLLYYRFSEQTHQKQSVKNTWEQGVIGFKGSSALKLAYWKRFACFVPFVRSLFPAKMQHFIYLALSRFDPRRS